MVDVLQTSPCDTVYHMYSASQARRPNEALRSRHEGHWLFIHGLGSRVQAPETTDLVEGGVVTGRNGGHQRTQGNTTHNTTDKPLHSTLIGPWPAAAGAACSCTAMWCETTRLYSRTPPHCEGHSAFPVDNRDEETMGGSTDSTTQWTWGLPGRSPAMATAYSPPHANRRGVRLRGGNAEQQATAHPE